jgi:hypothetical protein
MKILDFLLNDRLGHGLFIARSPKGDSVKLCRASFWHEGERNQLISDYPDILDWEVIEKHVQHEE